MTARINFRRAVRILSGPNPRLAASIAASNEADAKARCAVRAEIDAGADADELYRAECARRGTPDADRHRAVALLGYLRRGMTALEP